MLQQKTLLMLIQTAVTLFTGGIHCSKLGTKHLPGMISIAKIKSLQVNKKRKKKLGKLLNMNVNIFNGLHFLLCAACFCQGNMIIIN